MKMYSTVAQSLLFVVGMLTLPTNVRWSQDGVTVAGGNEYRDDTNQLNGPFGLHIDDDNQSLAIADFWNRSIVE